MTLARRFSADALERTAGFAVGIDVHFVRATSILQLLIACR